MHEDNHAEIVPTSSRFSHRRTTNAISISYGFSREALSKLNRQGHRIGPEEWKENIPIIPAIPLSRQRDYGSASTLLIHPNSPNILCLIPQILLNLTLTQDAAC
jgi:hypothetical protein